MKMRVASKTDGGGRGGTQLHISVPVANYQVESILEEKSSFEHSRSGYSVVVIDESTSTLTFFVLWNVDRLLILFIYKLLLLFFIFRLFTFSCLRAYIHFNQVSHRIIDIISYRLLQSLNRKKQPQSLIF